MRGKFTKNRDTLTNPATCYLLLAFTVSIGCADDRRRIIRVIFLDRCASCLSTSYNLAHLIVFTHLTGLRVIGF